MKINDYLIEQRGNNWPRLLRDWLPSLPSRFTIWFVSRLGDVFVLAPAGCILRLDLGSGTCVEVARDQQHFAAQLDMADVANLWLRIELVDACRRAGMTLGPQECYGFRIPPTLGGAYEVSNLKPTSLAVHYSYQAYICKQTDVYWVAPV
jgi:hypothetical protein